MKIYRPVILAVAFCLILSGLLNCIWAQEIEEFPEYGRASEERAAEFNTTAKTILAPAYPYLAKFISDRFSLEEKQGIGIDIGGGPGDLVLELCKQAPGFFWINSDINTSFSAFFYQGAADNRCSQHVGFVFADAHSLPFRDEYADIVVSRGSLQRWKDRNRAFAEIYRVLKPGGQAIVGRGFSGNMPLEEAKRVRQKQGGGPKYIPADTAVELERIMKNLQISSYEIILPGLEQNQVNYGIWVVFSKPEE